MSVGPIVGGIVGASIGTAIVAACAWAGYRLAARRRLEPLQVMIPKDVGTQPVPIVRSSIVPISMAGAAHTPPVPGLVATHSGWGLRPPKRPGSAKKKMMRSPARRASANALPALSELGESEFGDVEEPERDNARTERSGSIVNIAAEPGKLGGARCRTLALGAGPPQPPSEILSIQQPTPEAGGDQRERAEICQSRGPHRDQSGAGKDPVSGHEDVTEARLLSPASQEASSTQLVMVVRGRGRIGSGSGTKSEGLTTASDDEASTSSPSVESDAADLTHSPSSTISSAMPRHIPKASIESHPSVPPLDEFGSDFTSPLSSVSSRDDSLPLPATPTVTPDGTPDGTLAARIPSNRRSWPRLDEAASDDTRRASLRSFMRDHYV